MSSPAKLRPAPTPAAAVPSTPRWPLPTVASRAALEELLTDDVPYGDLTTDALGIGAAPGTMQFTARDAMVLALAEDAAAIIELAGCRVELLAPSGTTLEEGSPILVAHVALSFHRRRRKLLRRWAAGPNCIPGRCELPIHRACSTSESEEWASRSFDYGILLHLASGR